MTFPIIYHFFTEKNWVVKLKKKISAKTLEPGKNLEIYLLTIKKKLDTIC